MKVLTRAVLISSLIISSQAHATAMREFMLSCTYGTLAGTMVGAATLAFTNKPGENLNKVARGASIGLYVGIALGVYIVYILPNQEQPEDPDLYQEPTGMLKFKEKKEPSWVVGPMLGDHGLEGLTAQVKLLSF
jgi:hypothetical protein